MISSKLLLAYILQTFSIGGIPVDTSMIDPNEAYCLAKNIYYEARGENIQGQFAVAAVTLNRVKDPRYPGTVCEVVKQTAVLRGTKKVSCAFSWYCHEDKKDKEVVLRKRDGSIDQIAVDKFQVATFVAIATLSGAVKDNTRGATHFHNPEQSDPAWRHTLKKTVSLGNHDFYKF